MLKSKKNLGETFIMFMKNTSKMMGMNMASVSVKMYLFFHKIFDATVEGTLYTWGCRK